VSGGILDLISSNHFVCAHLSPTVHQEEEKLRPRGVKWFLQCRTEPTSYLYKEQNTPRTSHPKPYTFALTVSVAQESGQDFASDLLSRLWSSVSQNWDLR
jgi:hypothetical protein